MEDGGLRPEGFLIQGLLVLIEWFLNCAARQNEAWHARTETTDKEGKLKLFHEDAEIWSRGHKDIVTRVR